MRHRLVPLPATLIWPSNAFSHRPSLQKSNHVTTALCGLLSLSTQKGGKRTDSVHNHLTWPVTMWLHPPLSGSRGNTHTWREQARHTRGGQEEKKVKQLHIPLRRSLLCKDQGLVGWTAQPWSGVWGRTEFKLFSSWCRLYCFTLLSWILIGFLSGFWLKKKDFFFFTWMKVDKDTRARRCHFAARASGRRGRCEKIMPRGATSDSCNKKQAAFCIPGHAVWHKADTGGRHTDWQTFIWSKSRMSCGE